MLDLVKTHAWEHVQVFINAVTIHSFFVDDDGWLTVVIYPASVVNLGSWLQNRRVSTVSLD